MTEPIRADLLESGELPEGWEREEEVRMVEPVMGRCVDREAILYLPDGTPVDISTWPRRTVLHGPWREGRHD